MNFTRLFAAPALTAIPTPSLAQDAGPVPTNVIINNVRT